MSDYKVQLEVFEGPLDLLLYLIKKNFEKAEASLNELYGKIVAAVGKPDQEKKLNRCSYTSQVFSKGARSCDVIIYGLYEARDADTSTQLMKNISSIVGSSRVKKVRGIIAEDSFVAGSSMNPHSFGQDHMNISAIDCVGSYSYPVSNGTNKIFTSHSDQNFELVLSCGGPAKAEHYPVSN